MKKLTAIGLAVAMLAMAGVAMAGDTAIVNVSAKVTGTCKFNNGGSLSFTLDPATGGTVSGTATQPQFWCTNGTSYTISDDNGKYESGTTYQLKHATLDKYIPYSFSYASTGTGAGKNSPITMNIAGEVLQGDYEDAVDGNYSDTITLTVAP